MSSSKRVVALLPMKANSERVKGKNFKQLAGKPLFQWILDSLLAVDEISLVVINTDAKQILLDNGLVENDRVLIRERPKDLCGDLVSMNLIIENDIDNIEADTYLTTHTTNPLISASTIRGALGAYQNGQPKYDSLFTVNKIQTRFYSSDASPINHDPDNLVRTQDLESWYEENSCLYVFSKASFDKTKARIGKVPQLFQTTQLESIDIDEPDDWVIAEAVAEYQIRSGG